jgi:hypothetical protein
MTALVAPPFYQGRQGMAMLDSWNNA